MILREIYFDIVDWNEVVQNTGGCISTDELTRQRSDCQAWYTRKAACGVPSPLWHSAQIQLEQKCMLVNALVKKPAYKLSRIYFSIISMLK